MKMKKQLLALLLAAVMVFSLTGCKETLKKVAQKVTGHSEEVQEEDTTRWAEATADPLIIQALRMPRQSMPPPPQTAVCTRCSTASGAATPATLPCRAAV